MKKLSALVVSVVALVAFAAPASAAPRMFSVTASCVPAGGGLYLSQSTDIAGEAQQTAIVGLRQFLKFDQERCEPGTWEITVEPQ
jgi:hypothetical protein